MTRLAPDLFSIADAGRPSSLEESASASTIRRLRWPPKSQFAAVSGGGLPLPWNGDTPASLVRLNRTMRLRLLDNSTHQASASFDPPPFSLVVLPGRPGQGREALAVDLEPEPWARVVAEAAAARIPAPLMATIWIESERSVQRASEATGVAVERLVVDLDAAATRAVSEERALIQPAGARRLAAYARCVAFGDRTVRVASREVPTTLDLSPEQLTSWHAAALAAGVSLGAWINASLVAVRPGRQTWEAAAAFAGISLGEWVLTQAARASRR